MKAFFILLTVFFISTQSKSQVGIGTTTPSAAAVLEVSSSTDQGATHGGFMPPRVPDIATRDQISLTAADEGLMVYIQGIGCLQVWNGISWENIHCNNSSALASDLFISEYVEGSSFNKVIEIANFTGSPKSLDYYKLAIYYNGLTSASPLSFIPGYTLNNGEVYVIKHTDADPLIIANQLHNTLEFNGNDAVILQSSSGARIDVLGEVGNITNYAKDVTLRKKPTLGPSLTYRPSDYIVSGQDDFSNLGSHNY